MSNINRIGTYTLRNGGPRDLVSIKDFFKKKGSAFNAERGDDQMLTSLTNRETLLTTEPTSSEIVAVCSIFNYLESAYAEFGATRITAPVGGIDYQSLLIKLRSVHSRIHNSTLQRIFTVVARNNEKSLKELLSNGFEEWNNPCEDLIIERERLTERPINFDKSMVLTLPLETIPDHAKYIVELFEEESIATGNVQDHLFYRQSRQGNQTEEILIRFPIEALLSYWPVLLALSKGEPIF